MRLSPVGAHQLRQRDPRPSRAAFPQRSPSPASAPAPRGRRQRATARQRSPRPLAPQRQVVAELLVIPTTSPLRLLPCQPGTRATRLCCCVTTSPRCPLAAPLQWLAAFSGARSPRSCGPACSCAGAWPLTRGARASEPSSRAAAAACSPGPRTAASTAGAAIAPARWPASAGPTQVALRWPLQPVHHDCCGQPAAAGAGQLRARGVGAGLGLVARERSGPDAPRRAPGLEGRQPQRERQRLAQQQEGQET